jgi:toxin ParE1/3/4
VTAAVLRTPEAIDDLDQIARHIGRDSFSASLRWLTEMDALFDSLSTRPEIGERVKSRRLGDVRRHAHGNYVVYYRPVRDGIQLMRVLQGARDHRRLT